jgi:hypothetical protein
MPIEKLSLCLNTDDPEQKELFEFSTQLPNGKKRNTSAFLRTLVDREYQKKKDEYLAEKKKGTHEATPGKAIKSNKGNIQYLAKDINQNSN